MAEGGRHLPKSDNARPDRSVRRQSARQEPVWEEEEQYIPPRRAEPVRRQPVQPTRPVRQQPVQQDWQEEEWQEEQPRSRSSQAQPRQREYYERTPRREQYYAPPQRQGQYYDRTPQQAQYYDPAPRQGEYYDQRDPRRTAAPRQDPYYYDRTPQPRRGRVEVAPPAYQNRRRGRQRQSLPLILLVVVLVAGVVVAGGKLVSVMLNYQRDRSAYNTLADQALSSMAEPEATLPPGETPDPNMTQQNAQSEVPFQVDWDLLRSQNSDVIGWLYDPGGSISYPVMQTGDNEFYLHRGWDKQPNTAGSLFADPTAQAGVVHSNFIIWGHNMKDGSMFASLQKYVDQSYYEQHPTMYYLTPTQNYRVELIAAHIVEGTLDNFPGYFSNDNDYGTYLNQITSHSFFWTRSSVSTSNQLITLSTCDYSANYADPRFLVQGMLIPVN